MVNPGTTVGGKYRLEMKIAQGASSSIWSASHETLGRPVAVKFMESPGKSSHERVQRFMREAKLASAVQHRYIVDIFDFGQTEWGMPYMVMELLQGTPLSTRISMGAPMAVHELLHHMEMVLTGLHAAHQVGIVHRDLKPENIFLIDDGAECYPKILDFGISILANHGADEAVERLTQEGAILGTLWYMSPEQVRGRRDIDYRTDLYSLGVMLYEILVGDSPFSADTVGELLIKIATETPPPLIEQRPDVGQALSDLVGKAMAKRRRDRFASADDMRLAMQALPPVPRELLTAIVVNAGPETPRPGSPDDDAVLFGATDGGGPFGASDDAGGLLSSLEPEPQLLDAPGTEVQTTPPFGAADQGGVQPRWPVGTGAPSGAPLSFGWPAEGGGVPSFSSSEPTPSEPTPVTPPPAIGTGAEAPPPPVVAPPVIGTGADTPLVVTGAGGEVPPAVLGAAAGAEESSLASGSDAADRDLSPLAGIGLPEPPPAAILSDESPRVTVPIVAPPPTLWSRLSGRLRVLANWRQLNPRDHAVEIGLFLGAAGFVIGAFLAWQEQGCSPSLSGGNQILARDRGGDGDSDAGADAGDSVENPVGAHSGGDGGAGDGGSGDDGVQQRPAPTKVAPSRPRRQRVQSRARRQKRRNARQSQQRRRRRDSQPAKKRASPPRKKQVSPPQEKQVSPPRDKEQTTTKRRSTGPDAPNAFRNPGF
jgi:serine/threonine-protein kinase